MTQAFEKELDSRYFYYNSERAKYLQEADQQFTAVQVDCQYHKHDLDCVHYINDRWIWV